MKGALLNGSMYRAICLVILLLLTATLVGCGLGTGKGDFAGPDWSRGKLLGTANINNRPALVWHAETQSAILSWLTKVAGKWRLQFVRVDHEGNIVTSQLLPFLLRQPSQPKLFCDSADGLHLFWQDQERDGEPGVYYVRLGAEAQTPHEPQRLSSAKSNVAGYAVTEALPGFLEIFWSDQAENPPLLYHARIQCSSGEVVVPPHALEASGLHPSCVAAMDGDVHLAWHRAQTISEEQILYGTFHPQTLELGYIGMIASFPKGTGLILYPPEIGLDTEHVYIFSAQERRAGGLTAGTAQTYCFTFPLSDPMAQVGATLDIPGAARPEYKSVSGAFNYKHLAWLGEVSGVPGVYREYIFFPSVPSFEYGPAGASQAGVDKEFVYIPRAPGDPSERGPSPGPIPYRLKIEYTYMPYAIPGQREELGLVVSCMMALSQQAEGQVQIAFVAMKSGHWKGLQVAGITRSASMRPIAVADDKGAIHLAWLDAGGFGQYEVYYASTSSSVRAALNRLTVEDVLALLIGKTWSAASAFSFLPVLILWLFFPLMWLIGFHFFRPDSDLRTRTGWSGLAIAIVLYFLSKMFAVPAFLRYTPLLDTIAPRFQDLVIFGFPILIATISLCMMAVYIRRSERKAVWVAFVLFAATDSLLSLILYMSNVLGI